MEELDVKMKMILKPMEEYEKNIYTLNDMKRQRKTLSEEKQEILDDMTVKYDELKNEFEILKTEYDSIQNFLNTLKIRGKIGVSGRIFPGTKIIIRDVKEDIKNEYRGLTFFLENMLIKTTKYEEIDEDIIKKGPPDASKSN
jgi:uncharacterized protein (DUF342 family)